MYFKEISFYSSEGSSVEILRQKVTKAKEKLFKARV